MSLIFQNWHFALSYLICCLTYYTLFLMPVQTEIEFHASKIFVWIVNFFFVVSLSMLKLTLIIDITIQLITIFVLACIKFFFLKVKK